MNHLLREALKLCLVTNIKNHNMTTYKNFIMRAVLGGVTMVQLREKQGNYEEIKYKALELRSILKPMSIPLIINDFVELAVEVDADGVHIGQNDMSVLKARKILGSNRIIGISIESLEELYEANNTRGINYITASVVYPSKTKLDCKKIWGIEGLRQVIKDSKHFVTAIGGINSNNVSNILNEGACGIAVIEAIHNAKDPYIAALSLRGAIDTFYWTM